MGWGDGGDWPVPERDGGVGRIKGVLLPLAVEAAGTALSTEPLDPQALGAPSVGGTNPVGEVVREPGDDQDA
jgi:hypothetical protein